MTNNFKSLNRSDLTNYNFKLNRRGLTDFGYKIFLDRYSMKDTTRQTLQPGDLVLVKTDNNTGQKEIAEVVELNGDYADVIIHPANPDAMEWQPIAIEHVDKPLELDPALMWQRVAEAMAANEEDQKTWYERFYWLLEDWKFLPGGRILAAAGTGTRLSCYNCHVLPSPVDSKQGIFDTLSQMAHIMAAGGGVGINISTLRPRYSHTKSTNGRSSGAVCWGELFSYTTGLIEGGGSRRGAGMLILEDWHPDIFEFVNVKRDNKRITNANISVGISDEFMEAVKADSDWQLIFPDTTYPNYKQLWKGDIKEWVDANRPIKVWKTIKARELWNAIINSAWACAEPGIWFNGRANKFSNSQYYAPLIATNPCAEEPLPAWSVCLLGAINLSKFVLNVVGEDFCTISWVGLGKAVRYAIRFLDNVIDATPYIYPEIDKKQKSERRIGLGTMGLAEVLIRMKLRYGSEESLKFIDELYKFIATTAYDESVNLAIEKGAFPEFNATGIMQSRFMQLLPLDLGNRIMEHGLRNVTLLTQAPTGTVGTMVNTSTGIEPFYFWEYERKGRLGSHTERVKVYDEWLNRKDIPPDDDEPLPSWFVTAQDLTPEEHVHVQATIQRWVDSSISKTCNLPNNYTVEQVSNIYKLMYDLGCKGGTIYRDGSRDEQILNLKPQNNTASQDRTHSGKEEHAPAQSVTWRKRPAQLTGTSFRKSTPVGSAYIAVNDNGTGEPFEVFITVGRAGSDIAADAEGLGRLISLILRMPSALSVQERIENIVAQLGGIGSGRAQGFGPNRVMSLPDAVAQVLSERAGLSGELPGLPEYEVVEQPKTLYYNGNADICPGCGNASLMRVEGCSKCYGCGFSQC